MKYSTKIEILDKLVELGYIEKRSDTVYFVHFYFEAHPYVPRVGWQGIVGIASKSQVTNKTLILDSRQYANFMESAKIFKNQCSAGMHKHITQFSYADMFHYETIVYELYDIFFDAIYVDYSESDQKLYVKLVE